MSKRTQEETEFDNSFDARGMLRDGITRLRVPVQLIDSAADPPKADYHVRVDADVALASHPGFVARTRRDALADCYETYDQAISNAWRDPDNNGVGSHGFVGARPGDICTINGRAGHLQVVGGELKCVADRKPADATSRTPKFFETNLDWLTDDDGNTTKDASYAEYDANLRDAWRRAR